MKILIIEDEKELSDSIAAYLTSQDYTCDTAIDFNEAMRKTESFDYDCILLDIALPGGNGLKVLESLKENNKNDGVLILSAKNSLDDKISGLNMGADDYLAKPFDLSELNARIAAIIRRKNFDGHNVIKFHNIEVDAQNKSITVNNNPVTLTRKEFDLLLYFISNKKRVISKDAIARHLWAMKWVEIMISFIRTLKIYGKNCPMPVTQTI